MSGKFVIVCLVICSVASMNASCSREDLIGPDGSAVNNGGNDIASSGYRIIADADINAREITVVLYDEYDKMCFVGRAAVDFELQKCLSSTQIRNLNKNHYVRITDAGTCIDIALKTGIDLKPELFARATVLELLEGSWSCIKGCYTIEDPIRKAQCWKNCEEKDPYQQ